MTPSGLRCLCKALALWFTALGTPVSAQDEGCIFGDQGNDNVLYETLPNGDQITYVSSPHFVCADGIQIWADTAVAYAPQGLSHLMGAVRYVDATRELRADEARYFSNQGRLQAQGHMSIRDGERSSIENGDLVYLRRTAFRDEETITVIGAVNESRPRAVLAPPSPDSTAGSVPPPAPYTVVGDRIFLRGTSYFTAGGKVEIIRDALFAFADSVEYDESLGNLLLDGSARVEGDAYDLRGQRITLGTPEAETSEVHATRDARLMGDNLLLTSAQIVVYLRNDALERLVATPMTRSDVSEADSSELARPVATVDNFVLTADSLDVTAPNETVERVFAAGSARSVSSTGDSLSVAALPGIAQSDWLEGDTVIVTFVVPESEQRDPGNEGLQVKRIVARVRARSLYRLAPSDTMAVVGTDLPAVHYVVGNEITIDMEDGTIQRMRVAGQTRGAHLEPLAREETSSDTIGEPDTTASVDTTSITSRDGDPSDGTTWNDVSGPLTDLSQLTFEAPQTHEPAAAHDARREEELWIGA